MGFKNLTLDDVLGDKINEKAFEAPAQKAKSSGVPTVNGKKMYRTRSGEYVGELSKTWIRITEAGRKYVSILVKLYTEEKAFRGSAFTKVSWNLVTKADGSPDLQFKLFQQLISVMGAPRTAGVDQVIGAIAGEYVQVWGQEHFDVKICDLQDKALAAAELAKGRKPENTKYVFIAEGDDAVAEHYMSLGYESKLFIMRISDMPA